MAMTADGSSDENNHLGKGEATRLALATGRERERRA